MTSLNRRALLSLAAALAAAPAWAQEAGAPAAADPAAAAPEVTDISYGDPAAPVKIIEYASYSCSHCATFHETVFKPLKKEYIDTGKVYLTVREFYRMPADFWAALIARCGDGTRYEAISAMVFEKQAQWLNSNDPNEIMENLRVIGVSAGLTREQIAACEADTATGEVMLRNFQENITKDNVTATPTVYVDGERVQDWSWPALKALIDGKIG